MRFLKNLYYSPNIEHPKTVCWRLAHQAGMLSVYVLYLPEGEPARTPEGHNQLELCHSAFLQQPWFKKHPPLIVGIAMGREQALELVRTIGQEALDKNHDTDIRKLLFPDGRTEDYVGCGFHGHFHPKTGKRKGDGK